MGARRVSGHGIVADRKSRSVLRHLAARLRVRIPAGGDCLLDCLSVVRVARIICCRCLAGRPCDFHAGQSSRITGLAAEPWPELLDESWSRTRSAKRAAVTGGACFQLSLLPNGG